MASTSVHRSNLERTRASIQTSNWRDSILSQLQSRKSVEQTPFEDICSFANSMFDKVDIYKSENIQLNLAREQLQQQLLGIQQTLLAGGSDAAKTIISKLSNVSLNDESSTTSTSSTTVKNLNIQYASVLAEKSQLEKKIIDLQEKLSDALKSNADTVKQIVDLKTQLEEKDRANRHFTTVLDQSEKDLIELRQALTDLEFKHAHMSDEYMASTLSYKSLEKKYQALILERDAMSIQILAAKRADAERLNAENDEAMKRQRERTKLELEENVNAMTREQLMRQVAGDPVAMKLAGMAADNFEDMGDDEDLRYFNMKSRIPSTVEHSFEAHEGGSTAVKWYCCNGPRDDYLATGGQDRKVKLWKIRDAASSQIGEGLHGSNSSITSIDVEGDAILASSCDMATRVWCLSTQRLIHTLTGHSAKVNSAKFLGTPTKIASGSADRTIKLWDVTKGCCSRTFFAASNCYDLVFGNYHIISCHFDKKLRGWDLNKPDDNNCAWTVLLGESKVISVDISRDASKVVCCLKGDNTIKCVDLRTNAVLQTYSHEKFRIGEENWRVNFSNDSQYIACGSSDGSFFIWDINTAKVEKALKGHNNKVLAACWSPDGKRMVSIENGRKVSIWA